MNIMEKLGKRTFSAPAIAALFAVVNDATKAGFNFWTILLIVTAALIWSAIETWRDTTMMKCGLWHKPAAPSSPATTTSSPASTGNVP